NKVYEFKDHRIKEYLGDIDSYLAERKVENIRELEKKEEVKKNVSTDKISRKLTYEEQKKLKSLKNKISNLEANINILESELKLLDKQLTDNYEQTSGDEAFFKKYESKKQELKKMMKNWEDKQLELEILEE